jgi:streptomycin 6-kinase
MPTSLESEGLERLAREAAAKWGVTLDRPFALSNYSYVAPAGGNAVLKVRDPADDESDEEPDALELWSGDGAVGLIRVSGDRRVFLLERAKPGTDISELAEDEATAIAVGVGQRLWRPASEPFRWIGDHVPRWLAQVERAQDARHELIRLARQLYESLQPGRSTLVHGDLHHHNILKAGNRYLAIDPKPMLGEAEFDVPSFLWNPIGYEMTPETTRRRLSKFAAAGLDEERMRAWSVIRGAYLGISDREVAVLRKLLT